MKTAAENLYYAKLASAAGVGAAGADPVVSKMGGELAGLLNLDPSVPYWWAYPVGSILSASLAVLYMQGDKKWPFRIRTSLLSVLYGLALSAIGLWALRTFAEIPPLPSVVLIAGVFMVTFFSNPLMELAKSMMLWAKRALPKVADKRLKIDSGHTPSDNTGMGFGEGGKGGKGG